MAQLHVTGRQKGEAVKPAATLKLIEKLGVTKAARELGVSPTLLHNARRKDVVSRVVEVASLSLLKSPGTENGTVTPEVTRPSKHEQPVLMLLEAPPDKARIIERLCKALG